MSSAAKMHPFAAFPLLLLLLLYTPISLATAGLGASGEGFASVLISETGLDFAKDLLVEQAVRTLAPLQLPNIEKSVKIPFLGGLHVVVSNLTLTDVQVSRSAIQPGDTGVVIVASDASASLSMAWRYSYSTWLVPIEVSDQGTASVQVDGIQVGLTISMENEEGTLKLSAKECGCYMKDIIITLEGGASWFYQGFVDAFEDQIRSVVEKGITKQIAEGIFKLDKVLQTFPKEIRVDDVVSMNVTFVDDPLLSKSSMEFEINGLFIPTGKIEGPQMETDKVPRFFLYKNPKLALCEGSSKMLGISLDEAIFNSASELYFKAGLLHWTVDKVPDQSLLNTAGWKFIIPQLFIKYPNDDMRLNLTFTSPPFIRITDKKIDVNINLDMTVDVLDTIDIVPVACISVVVKASGLPNIVGNNLGGKVDLESFSLKLKWSKVGNFHMFLIEKTVQVFLNTVFMPYVNLHLRNGFPLPIVDGFTVQDASIITDITTVTVCGDLFFTSASVNTLSPGLSLMRDFGAYPIRGNILES